MKISRFTEPSAGVAESHCPAWITTTSSPPLRASVRSKSKRSDSVSVSGSASALGISRSGKSLTRPHHAASSAANSSWPFTSRQTTHTRPFIFRISNAATKGCAASAISGTSAPGLARRSFATQGSDSASFKKDSSGENVIKVFLLNAAGLIGQRTAIQLPHRANSDTAVCEECRAAACDIPAL